LNLSRCKMSEPQFAMKLKYGPMSALDQKRTWRQVSVMSTLLPIADMAESDWHVRFGPKADMRRGRLFELCPRGGKASDRASTPSKSNLSPMLAVSGLVEGHRV